MSLGKNQIDLNGYSTCRCHHPGLRNTPNGANSFEVSGSSTRENKKFIIIQFVSIPNLDWLIYLQITVGVKTLNSFGACNASTLFIKGY